MKRFESWTLCISCVVVFLAADGFGQATVTGQVRSTIGIPIKGAMVKLTALNITRTTDDSGKYDFGAVSTLPVSAQPERYSYSIVARGKQMDLDVVAAQKFTIEMFDLSGRRVCTILDDRLAPGNHAVVLGSAALANQMYLVKILAGSRCSYFEFAPDIGMNVAKSLVSNNAALPKTAAVAAADSVVVTHPNFWGGLDAINTRKVSSVTGVQNFRMFPFDTSATGWFASKMNFVFTPDTTGVSYYKQKVPDYEYEERETQREVQQCLWRLPSDVPSIKKYATYNCNINATVTTGVAETGGNTLSFNPAYINNKPWWEILGVQHHEMVHSYQQFYNTTGADGFGEAIPDAIRCLTGFFYWPAGTKCSGGFAGTYQTGGKYWYYIELKHPGFIYKVMNTAQTGDISARVLSITGDSLSSMCTECESKGMPYTLGRGSF
jgi:Peptidase of plants and bacteria